MITQPARRKRILLVDDELAVRHSLRLLLLRDEHTVVEANNGAEAFALFCQGHFDLVVTDFEMPFVKGNELAARIKQVAPQLPILMITAYAHRPGRENPVNTVLEKPFDAARFRDVLAELLVQPGEDAPPTSTAEQTGHHVRHLSAVRGEAISSRATPRAPAPRHALV